MFRLNSCLLAIIVSSKELTNIQNKAQSSKLFVTARAFHPSFTPLSLPPPPIRCFMLYLMVRVNARL